MDFFNLSLSVCVTAYDDTFYSDENRHKLRFTANTHDGNEYIEMQKGNNSSKIANTHWHSSNGLFMSDGKRKIDYVLAYEVNYDSDYDENDNKDDPSTFTFTSGRINGELRRNKEKQANKRENFERNLEKLGLELEYVEGKYCKKTYFVLIHAPFALLMKQAENLAVKMPILRSDVKERTVFEGMLDRFLERFKFFKFDEITNERLKEPNYFTAPFIAAHLNCYVGHENPVTFFDDSERSRMVYDLLIRTRYDSDEKYRVGIERLINNGSYTAAFPLHEECESKIYDAQNCNNREMLYWNWALITNFYKYQPLSLIRKYFGSKIGIYFAWLGFYTKVLFPASILGILSLLYGLSTFSRDIPSNDICGTDGIGASIIICPACESFCDFARLNSSCIYSKLSYLFDNRITVVFAALMTISATLFLEGWKRYHAEFAWKWGLLDFEIDEETIRPEYQLRVKSLETKRVNPITQQMEPYFPFKKRLFRFVGSGVSVIFFLLLVIAFVIGIVIYRIVLLNVLYRMDGVKPYAALLTFSTASFLNLVVILMLSYFYTYLAIKLTEWECPRTQTDFDNSYTFKVYLFQFINYYSSIFYIAFIKGNLSSVPGRHFFGFQPEECDPAGCMVELVIQLAIIMCGKQFWNAFIEIAWPMMMNIIRSWNIFASKTKQMKKETIRRQWQDEMKCSSMTSRWEKDYVLNPVSRQFLFDEYLEMVIQFGFVTLFVSAFPLAPLFALLNNILEIRIDAYKYTMTTRRPVPERAKDIGVWFSILDGISRAAVLINVCQFF
ncbi:unnamed protein product [Dracunculus medinensis]|uniref:Anoctamin n=1 Tax=Dracunculus medinensis TaxID=318479 RepID=A0A0N4UN58_DRAME|nr:unnamed protein product [Dracunculus medinensis]